MQELGAGENGFDGTPVSGGLALKDYLHSLVDAAEGRKLPPGYVPQTTYWLRAPEGLVGVLRLRHRLNESLLKQGGHIGYWVRPSVRRKGYGAAALRLALAELKTIGEPNALVTVDKDNTPSNCTAASCGGRLEAGEDGVNRYWWTA